MVLTKADVESNVLTTDIPESFQEEVPNQILPSLRSFLKDHKSYEKTTVEKKNSENSYELLASVFHDIKIASALAIKEYKVGTTEYNDIDFFYKFASSLLLRESSRLNLTIKKEEFDSQTDFESIVFEDFDKISSGFSSDNGEVISIIHKTEVPADPTQNAYSAGSLYLHNNNQPEEKKYNSQPLFTSLTKKSEVDIRPTLIPDPFVLTKVVPSMKNPTRDSQTLNNISPAISKIPAATSQPTEMMLNFFHPNWYTLAVPTWLDYQGVIVNDPSMNSNALSKKLQEDGASSSSKRLGSWVRSFAPLVDLKLSIITEQHKSSVWLAHIGLDEIERIKKSYISSLETSNDSNETEAIIVSNNDELNNGDDMTGVEETKSEDVESDTKAKEGEVKEHEQENSDKTETEVEDSDFKINIDNLAKWDPSKIETFEDLKKDEQHITGSISEFQKLISKNLLKLNKLRNERFVRSTPNNVSIPSAIETKLYNKVLKLITLFIEHAKISRDQISLAFSKRLPVLLSEYSGTLPGSAIVSKNSGTNMSKGARLPSIRGPYKKKNRL